MRFRLASIADCKELTRVHLVTARDRSESFLDKLGKSFLFRFYWVSLHDPHSVILCAVDDKDPAKILGFSSGTLDAAQTNRVLVKYRLRLALGAALAVIKCPSLLGRIWSRFRSLRASPGDAGDNQYLTPCGARGAYWGMTPEGRHGLGTLELYRKWLQLMRLLGAGEIAFEVDDIEPAVVQTHQRMGAMIVRKSMTPEGKLRVFMQYPAPNEKNASKSGKS